ncbi:caspase family protein [Lentzea sp. CA-135723]|uniref:VMAP-C domain-containing protein n=1 Tax=Lentzea sp. CA-135723 TaxID=3239950 RepID=UPI003D94E2AD
MIVDPLRTRAVVVGVDEYGIEGWSLRGPVDDARKFVEWLVSRGVPAANIELLISRPAGPVCGVVPSEPVSWRVEKTFTKMTSLSSELLIVYWGGHGVADNMESCRLFYGDAVERSKLNLDLNTLLRAMRTDSYSSHPRQLVLVDACQTFVHDRGWVTSLPRFVPAMGRSESSRDQHVLFATSPGQLAVNDDTARTGLFSQAVREVLGQLAPGTWPPDPAALSDGVRRRFQAWYDEGRTDQVPSYVSFCGRGSEEHVVFSASAADPRATAFSSNLLLLEDDAVGRLRSIVEGVEVPADLALMYRDVARGIAGRMPPFPGSVWGVVSALRGATGAVPLFEFLARLASAGGRNSALLSWIKEHAPEHGIALESLARFSGPLRDVYLVQVTPDLLGAGFDVVLWCYGPCGGWQLMSTSDGLALGATRAALSGLLEEILAVAGFEPIVEFRLPVDLLEHPVDELVVCFGGYDQRLGDLCPVVVRPQDRPLSPEWERKWEQVRADQPGSARPMSADAVSAYDARALREAHTIGITRDRVTTPIFEAVEAVLAAGVPVVLWHRPSDLHLGYQKPTEKILLGRQPCAVPGAVKDQRFDAGRSHVPGDHPGLGVVLLWDDPNRIPPTMTWRAPV